jgi:hypothetical protein
MDALITALISLILFPIHLHTHPLTDPAKEAHAECIAIWLGTQPAAKWKLEAEMVAPNPNLCETVIQNNLAGNDNLKRKDFIKRLDIARHAEVKVP